MNEQDYEQLTLFPAGSPASLSLLPGSEEARKMTVSSGRKWLGLSRNFGPIGLLEKMLLESSEWHSEIFYLNWKAVDIGQGHFLFRLALSEPDIRDTVWQSWPTPKASMRGDCPSERKRRSPDLAAAVKMYNTPTAQDAKNSTLPISQINRDSLVGYVLREQFATPQARDYRTGQACRWENSNRSRNLNDQIAMYPTPTGARLCGGAHAKEHLEKMQKTGNISEEEKKSMQNGSGGQLNPNWVEWLMGFPVGWTEI